MFFHDFPNLSEKCLALCWKNLHFICPIGHIDINYFFEQIFFFLSFPDIEKNLSVFGKKLLPCCRNCILYFQLNTLRKSRFCFRKTTFNNHFQKLSKSHRFWTKVFSEESNIPASFSKLQSTCSNEHLRKK